MFYGSGILRGMLVTLKNFFVSYVAPRRAESMDTEGMVTLQYPEERLAEKQNFRNFPFLIYDNQPENLRCVACDICAKECPPKCIYIVREFDKDGKPLKKPATFDIDLTVCMNCGLCEEACPFDAIYMDHEFEIAGPERNEALLYHQNQLLKSNEYFHKIRPDEAAEIDARRKAVEDKKKAAAVAAAAAAKAAAAKPADPSSGGQAAQQPPTPEPPKAN